MHFNGREEGRNQKITIRRTVDQNAGLPYFGTDNLRQICDLAKTEVNSSVLPYKSETGLAINRIMSFNPNTADDVGIQSSSGDTPQQGFNEWYQNIPPAERVQFSPFCKGRSAVAQQDTPSVRRGQTRYDLRSHMFDYPVGPGNYNNNTCITSTFQYPNQGFSTLTPQHFYNVFDDQRNRGAQSK